MVNAKTRLKSVISKVFHFHQYCIPIYLYVCSMGIKSTMAIVCIHAEIYSCREIIVGHIPEKMCLAIATRS